jgi:hypothetical protein
MAVVLASFWMLQHREKLPAHGASAALGDDTTDERIISLYEMIRLTPRLYCCPINAVNLEDVLREVQPDRGNLFHGWSPLMSARSTTSSWHVDAAAGPSTPSL